MTPEGGECYIVTGGASGIGLAVARQLARRSHRVVILDRKVDNQSHLLDDGVAVSIHPVDVRDEEAVTACVAQIAQQEPRLAGLVNSAGVGENLGIEDTTKARFDHALAINLTGSFLVSREVARQIIARDGRGAIVNVSSVSGLRGSPGRAAYAASKGGVVNLTRAMAVELARRKIRVNCIAPGPVETPLLHKVQPDETRAMMRRLVPQGRLGQPEDIAPAICFLLDDRAAGFITGQTLPVDGGMTASAGWTA